MLDDGRYAYDVSYPFRFTADCDLEMDENEEVIDQSLQLITFTPKGTIMLFVGFGSVFQTAVFDPLDQVTQLIIDTALRTAFEVYEPRVYLDKEFIFDESPDERKLIVIVPYKIKVNGEPTATKLIIDRPLNS